jgi:hypothetical protein
MVVVQQAAKTLAAFDFAGWSAISGLDSMSLLSND